MDSGTARRYLRVILRYWWLLLLSTLIPAGISYHLASQEPDLYESKAKLIVGTSVFQDVNPNPQAIDLSNTLAAAYAELVTQPSVLEPVIDRLALDQTPERLAAQIDTGIRSGAQLLEISVTDTSAEAAALIANALADELIRRSPTSEENTPEQQAFIEGQLRELEGKIEDVNQQISDLTASLAQLTSAAEIEEAEGRIDALDQVKSRYQTTYAQLLSVSHRESSNELALFEPATVPERPLPTRTGLIGALAGAAGLGLALGGVLVLEYLDSSLRWEQGDKQTVMDLPVLGAVPHASSRTPLSSQDPLSPVAESIRGLRSQLELIRPDGFFKTLLLTSPGNAEGKSFIVANLAVVLASGNQRVVVVDADMRRPSLHEFFDRPNILGLADVLGNPGRDSESPVPMIPLQETDFENLLLLSSGRPPTDPAALLTSSRFPSLLANLGRHQDVILIDSPPILGPPDATIIATQVEGTIIVVSTGLTRQEAGQQAKELLLKQQDASLLGLAVNHVNTDGYYQYYTSAREAPRSRWRFWERNRDSGPLTLRQAASRLGIGREQARRWCKSGRLPATRRCLLWWRVEREGLAQLIDQTVGGTSANHSVEAGTVPSEER